MMAFMAKTDSGSDLTRESLFRSVINQRYSPKAEAQSEIESFADLQGRIEAR